MNTRSTRRLILAALWIGMMIGAMGTGLASSLLGSTLFSDVRPGSFYDAAIGDVVNAGLMKGFGDGRFAPNEYVTRGQLAVILQRIGVGGERSSVSTSSSSSQRSSISTLSSEGSSSSLSPSSSSVTSLGYNPAGYLRFTSATYSINESIGTLNIVVVRTGGNQGTVTADYAFVPGTAVAGTDYVDSSGTISLANKETSKKITIQVKDDGQSKDGRNFRIDLKNPKYGVGIATPGSTTISILDRFSSNSSASSSGISSSSSSINTPVLSLGATAYAAIENGGSITITVNRTGITSTPVTVNYSTNNGTANSSDYTSTSGMLSFAANETSKSFNITLNDDSNIDGSKTVNVLLSNPTGGAVISTPSSLLTIYDNESSSYGSGSLKFSKVNYDVTEAAGKITITVNRTGGASGTATVSYQASGGSATAGSDFEGVAGTLTFASGEAAKTFDVPVYKDSQSEGDETINLTLSSPSGAALGDQIFSIVHLYD